MEATRTITLSDGNEVLVDAVDYEWLSRWKWKRHIQGYACRTTYDKETKRFPLLLMHRIILGDIPPGMTVDHINREKRDNRRSNLRIVTQGENNRNRPRESWPLHYPDEKTCEVCGEAYKPNPRKRKRQQACSKECAYRLRQRTYAAIMAARKAA